MAPGANRLRGFVGALPPAAIINFEPGSGPTANNLRLADEIASAWVAMAANGKPDNPKTPAWAPYDLKNRKTLVFGDPSRTEHDPRRFFREYWTADAEKRRS